MEQVSIGERLKILMAALGLKVRAFAQTLGVSETTIRNYTERGSKPSSEFLENVINHFEKTNPVFLLTGRGTPLLDEEETVTIRTTVSGEKSTVTNIGKTIGGTLQIGNLSLADCRQELTAALAEIASLRTQVEASSIVIQSKDALIAAKDETITLLRASYGRPN